VTFININNNDVVSLTNKLEKMHKSYLPRVVKKTLDTAALKDTKQNTMLKSAGKNFKDERTNLSFFRSSSKVKFAKGWNVGNMYSEIGFVGNGSKSDAVEDLEKQEKGGVIGGRAFIPLDTARTGKSYKRKVQKKYRISDIKSKIIDSKDNKKGKNPKEKYIISAIHAGKGGFVISTDTNSKGNRTLYEISKIGKSQKDGKTFIKSKPIFSVSAGRSVKVNKTRFMTEAGKNTVKLMPKNYITFAKEQIKIIR